MRKTILITFFGMLFLTLTSFSVHKFYVSLYQVNYAPEKKMIQITARLFVDDVNNSIGKKYSVRVDAIQYLNLLEGLTISVGQRLIINPAITSADTKDPQSTPGLHVVRQGETLFSIAKQYGLKTSDIMATNDLTTDQVAIGQKLVIVKPIQK